ncbi:pyridoxine 4-oxidase [Hypericibacter terrae]|uniref:Pyridoxine 4-oxidase n=1 Tax=Hypericibacter terrae TaxID=2602015 RepID=A0A5J6MMN6_9PROT|nr:GMC family oxidoreductase N-terminal domain-containing protein [Hypericibacter terrae]QEX18734.1 pyridoxine 4-oxidase [Hypericibacter terrae]
MRTFDWIILGAGTAGSVLAARLSEDPAVSVALVEAGGAPTDPQVGVPRAWPALQGTAIDWNYATVPQRHTANRVHAWARGRVRGGSSTINAMAHVRGHPSDFDAWVAVGAAGWGYRDLLPYFIRSEDWDRGASPYHGQGGPVSLMTPSDPHPITRAYMAAGEEIGLTPTPEHNGPRMAGPTLNSLTIKEGRRQSTADAYLTPDVLARPNLHLLERHEIRGLRFEGQRHCRGVELQGPEGIERIAAERGVLLATGAIASPTLLLRAGIGPADELKSLGIPVRLDLPGVGHNLHDHLLSGGNVYRARRPVPPSRYQNSESLMYIERSGAGSAPELVLACVIAPAVTECFPAPAFGEAYTLMFGFTQPRSRGSLRLASADAKVAPLIDPNYLAEEYDRRAYLDALERAQAVGGARSLADWREAELLPGQQCRSEADRRAFLARAAYTHHHPVGTCRMGTDAEAVVTPELALRGIGGLHVVDASVIPRITTGPVNAAIIALAERASDLLRGRPPLAPATWA